MLQASLLQLLLFFFQILLGQDHHHVIIHALDHSDMVPMKTAVTSASKARFYEADDLAKSIPPLVRQTNHFCR